MNRLHGFHLALLAFMPLTGVLAEDEAGLESTIMLSGSWVPEDTHQIDYGKLPRIKVTHTMISDVRD